MKCLICKAETKTTGREIEKMNLLQCPSCLSEFLYPQPNDEKLRELYSGKYYNSWGSKTTMESTIRMKKLTGYRYLDRIAEYAGSGKILDIGCAMGFFLDAARERGFEPYGVEFSTYSAEIARKKFGNDVIFHGTLEQSDFNEDTFDVITMFDLLEHVRNPLNTLKIASRLLKRNGIIMITTPDLSRFLRLLMGKKWLHYKAEHLYYFHRNGILKLFVKAGFKIENIETAKKAFTLSYAFHQFSVYNHFLISPVINIMNKLLPSGIKNRPFYLKLGEMNIILSKS